MPDLPAFEWAPDEHVCQYRVEAHILTTERDEALARLARVEAYRHQCAVMRVEPSSKGLADALYVEPDVHAWPKRTGDPTPCCGKTVLELAAEGRARKERNVQFESRDRGVTCKGLVAGNPPIE